MFPNKPKPIHKVLHSSNLCIFDSGRPQPYSQTFCQLKNVSHCSSGEKK